MATTTTFTFEDVASHNTKGDVYMIVHNKVYNLSEYAHKHPGGENLIYDLAGQDATEAFEDVGHSSDARKDLEEHFVGKLDIQVGTVPETVLSSTKNNDLTLPIFKEQGILFSLAILMILCYFVPGFNTPS